MKLGFRVASAARRRLAFPVLSFVFPTDCLACDQPLGELQRFGACAECWSRLEPLRPPLCASCGIPLPRGTDLLGPARGRCASCAIRSASHDGVRAAVLYEGAARRFLLRAKLGGKPEILAGLGAQLAGVLLASGFARGCSVVVPVPSHPWPLVRRGFSPAEEIARPVARVLGLPLETRLLRRKWGSFASAKRMGARQRRRSLHEAFRASRSRLWGRILLVDDVLTTGATAEACATALRRSGASEVRVAVWGRTPRRLEAPGSAF